MSRRPRTASRVAAISTPSPVRAIAVTRALVSSVTPAPVSSRAMAWATST